MTFLFIAFVMLALAVQVAIFFVIRDHKRKIRKSNVILKYNIKSASDAFRLLNDQNVPTKDRENLWRSSLVLLCHLQIFDHP